MKGLLLKDFYNLLKSVKQTAVIFVGMTIWAYCIKNPIFIGFYTIFLAQSLVMNSFSFDEFTKFDKYALTMPINREMLVREKYVLMLSLLFGGMLIGVFSTGIFCVLIGKESFTESVTVLFATGAFMLCSCCIIFPKIFQIGIEKARNLMIVVSMLILGGFYVLQRSLSKTGIFMKILDSSWLLVILALIGAVAAVLVSYVFSIKVIRKKEW